MSANTLFLRLEGPLQSWGAQEGKFVIRRTMEAPTKSGVIGMLCAALGVSRAEAPKKWLPELTLLRMGVRIDRPGVRWWDFHTVGAKMEMPTAEGKSKIGALLSRREYLCDASFLVTLQGNPEIISELEKALQNPKWTLYLGRKSCPPSTPIIENPHTGEFNDLETALTAIPWRKRFKDKRPPKQKPEQKVVSLIEWNPTIQQPEAPPSAEVWYDVPVSFDPPAHIPRFIRRGDFTIGKDGQVSIDDEHLLPKTPAPLSPRANYTNRQYREIRKERMQADKYLCVFCKAPATTVQHITYSHAGGGEKKEELRTLCRLCHDAVTMIEYGLGMGLDRINPEDPKWRDDIIEKRQEIVNNRSLETRRRYLKLEDVE